MIPSDYTFKFPLSEEGVAEGCQKLKETVKNTQSLPSVKISLVFESTLKPEYEYSATLERDMFSTLTFNSLKSNKIEIIKKCVQEIGISVNNVIRNGKVLQKKTSGGGDIVLGNRTEIVGFKGGITAIRALFPGKTDEEIQALFAMK
jgi:hypothetical protein